MSKKFGAGAHASARAERRHPACACLGLALFLAALSFGPFLTSSGSAQRPNEPSARAAQGPVVATKATRNAALVAATNDVLKETSEIRQLSILHPVQSSTQSREEIERMLIKNLDEEMTPGQIHAAEITLKKLDLAPGDFQYRAFMLRLLTEQVAGYYDPRTQEFHLADWIDLDGQKPIMAHELTHALQDQHFNLRRFEHWPKGDSDAELAAHALIEGDATLTMALYVATNPLRALAFLKSLGATGMSTAELDKAPRALRETLLFPYQEGTDWTRTLYKQGGWERVSKAFVELPQSTEQILHPEKYFAREAPVKVSLPDITNLLNASSNGGARGRQPAVSLLTAHSSLLTRYRKSVPPAPAGGYSSLITHHSSLRADPRPPDPRPLEKDRARRRRRVGFLSDSRSVSKIGRRIAARGRRLGRRPLRSLRRPARRSLFHLARGLGYRN